MRFLQRVAEQLKQVWLGMSMARRVGFVVLSALCLAVIVGVGYWASQPDYRVLYSGLSVDDASAITAKLQAQNTSFRLTSGGTSILVPAEQVQQLRLDLAAEGLPAKGGKGFEILDGSSIGLTPFLQQVNYSRASRRNWRRRSCSSNRSRMPASTSCVPSPLPSFGSGSPRRPVWS